MSNLPIQADRSIPSLPKSYIAAAALSALTFVVTTVALSVIPHAFPQVGLIGFSALGGGAGLSFIAVILSLCLLNRKRDKLLEVKESVPDRAPAPSQPVAAPPPSVVEAVVVEAPLPGSAADPVDEMTLFRQALPELFKQLDHLCSALVQANDKSEGRPPQAPVTYATQELAAALNAILDDSEQMSRLTFALIVTTSFKSDVFVRSTDDPQAFLDHLLTYCDHEVIRQLQPQIPFPARERGAFNQLYRDLRSKAARMEEAKTASEADRSSLQKKRDYHKAYEVFESAQIALFEWLLTRESVNTAQIQNLINQNTGLALQGICDQLQQTLLDGLCVLKRRYQTGFFNRNDVRTFFYAATLLNGKAIRARVKSMIRLMPLKRPYQDRIFNGFVTPIVQLLATPLYNATVNGSHPLRRAIQEQLIDQDGFAANAQLPDGTPVDQQIIFFANTLQQFATQINDLTFASA